MSYYPINGRISTRFFHILSMRLGKPSYGNMPVELVDKAFALLADKGMLFERLPDGITWLFPVKEYEVNTYFVKYLVDNDLIYTIYLVLIILFVVTMPLL